MATVGYIVSRWVSRESRVVLFDFRDFFFFLFCGRLQAPFLFLHDFPGFSLGASALRVSLLVYDARYIHRSRISACLSS